MKAKLKILFLTGLMWAQIPLYSCASASMVKCYPLLVTKEKQLVLLKLFISRSSEGCSHTVISEILSTDLKGTAELTGYSRDTFTNNDCDPKHQGEDFNTTDNKPLLKKVFTSAIQFCTKTFNISEWFGKPKVIMSKRNYGSQITLLGETKHVSIDSGAAYFKYHHYDSLFVVKQKVDGFTFKSDSVLFDNSYLSYISEEELQLFQYADFETYTPPWSIVEYSTASNIKVWQVHKLYSYDSDLAEYDKTNVVKYPEVKLTLPKNTFTFIPEDYQWHHSGFDFIYLKK